MNEIARNPSYMLLWPTDTPAIKLREMNHPMIVACFGCLLPEFFIRNIGTIATKSSQYASAGESAVEAEMAMKIDPEVEATIWDDYTDDFDDEDGDEDEDEEN